MLGAAILAVVLSGATISLVTPLAFGMSQLTQQSPDVEYYLVRWDLAGDPGRIGIHLTVDTRVTVGVPTLGEAAYVQECCGVTASTHYWDGYLPPAYWNYSAPYSGGAP